MKQPDKSLREQVAEIIDHVIKSYNSGDRVDRMLHGRERINEDIDRILSLLPQATEEVKEDVITDTDGDSLTVQKRLVTEAKSELRKLIEELPRYHVNGVYVKREDVLSLFEEE